MTNETIFNLVSGKTYCISFGFMSGMQGHIVATFQHYIVFGRWREDECVYPEFKVDKLPDGMKDDFAIVFDIGRFDFEEGFNFSDHFTDSLFDIAILKTMNEDLAAKSEDNDDKSVNHWLDSLEKRIDHIERWMYSKT